MKAILHGTNPQKLRQKTYRPLPFTYTPSQHVTSCNALPLAPPQPTISSINRSPPGIAFHSLISAM